MFLHPETISNLKLNALPKYAPAQLRIDEGLAFAKIATDLSPQALVQIVGMRKSISTIAAIALVEYHCPLN